MKAVMYHYVRPYDERLPRLARLDPANFRRQLDHFERRHGFVSREDWEDFISTGRQPKRSAVLLTFDDGTSCQYHHAFREMRKRGIWGIFFVSARPYLEERPLNVHRVHYLAARYTGAELMRLSTEILKADGVSKDVLRQFETTTYSAQDNPCGISDFKRLMNYLVAPEDQDAVLDTMFARLDCRISVADFYITPSELRDMVARGMTVAAHTSSHQLMSRLPLVRQRQDLARSVDFVRSVDPSGASLYAHPYGGRQSYNDDTLAALAELGVDHAFSVESRDLTATDLRDDPLALPRFDCNEFAHGRSAPVSQPAMVPAGILARGGEMVPGE